jgi:hypothetical protein
LDCPFLDNVHCTDPRSYKNGVPDDEKDLYLCTLGKFGMPPRWCKEYPYRRKKIDWLAYPRMVIIGLIVMFLLIVAKIGGIL